MGPLLVTDGLMGLTDLPEVTTKAQGEAEHIKTGSISPNALLAETQVRTAVIAMSFRSTPQFAVFVLCIPSAAIKYWYEETMLSSYLPRYPCSLPYLTHMTIFCVS